MLRTVLIPALLFACQALMAQPEKRVTSEITDVTVFLDRAQVTRHASVSLDAGRTNIIFHGLTSLLDQQSIQVSGKGKFTILGISHQQNYSKEFLNPISKMLKDSVELVNQLIQFEQSQKEILQKEEQMLLTNQKISGGDQNITVAELKAMADFFRLRLSDLVMQRRGHDNEIKDLSAKLVRILAQQAHHDELSKRNTSEIIVSVSSDAFARVDLQLRYIVADAGWLPIYDLRAIGTKNPVQLSYKANVFQKTGEEWTNVRLKLSTANPTLSGRKPELSPWYIDLIAPMVHASRLRQQYDSQEMPAPAYEALEGKTVGVEVDANTVAQYTTTIQTTLSTEFQIALPYTVHSSNKATLVDIASYALPAEYHYAVVPKLELSAFLIGKIAGWEELDLLPGDANVFFEGTFLGKTYVDPNNIEDTLQISLGRDKRIVVQRERIRDFNSRKVIGTNQREQFGYIISIRNTKDETISISVEDHVPVSQNNQVEVEATVTGNGAYDTTSGKINWQLSLKPQETRKLDYKFNVRYPKGKRIPEI